MKNLWFECIEPSRHQHRLGPWPDREATIVRPCNACHWKKHGRSPPRGSRIEMKPPRRDNIWFECAEPSKHQHRLGPWQAREAIVRPCAACYLKMHGTLPPRVVARVKPPPQYRGNVPWGFRLSEDRMTIVPDQGEQRVTAAARELRLTGLTYDQIAVQLGLRGFTDRNGGAFVKAQVSRMMV